MAPLVLNSVSQLFYPNSTLLLFSSRFNSPISSSLLSKPTTPFIELTKRWASKKAGGSTKNGRTSIGKRLGLKRYQGTTVKPGDIIVRQRGFQWHPGFNVGVGRDQTIYSKSHGKVVLHYNLLAARRMISIDDGTLPHLPSKPEMKKRLISTLDFDAYLKMDGVERWKYVLQKMKEIAKVDEEAKQKRVIDNLLEKRRKCDFVDLTRI